MSDGEPEFRITAVRSPNLTDEEIQQRWNQVFEILLEAGRETREKEAAPEAAKPKSPDTIRVTDDLFFEVGDDQLLLRRGKAAIMISPSEVRALLDGLMAAAAKLVGRQEQVGSEATKTTVPESMQVHHTDSPKS
jgi:hypothetical protein